MKILVTGGCGFIGSAIVRKLVKLGYHVLNLDKLTYAGHRENVEEIAKRSNYEFASIDIGDKQAVEKYFDYFAPDAVIHLAAESHVDRSIGEPSGFITTNVVGTFNILEASRLHWNRSGMSSGFRFLHVSTDEVFGSLSLDSTATFSEDTRYDPSSPYAASKASSDHLVKAWQKTYKLPTIVTNCSNNFGPFQHPEKLIPATIIRALNWKSITIYGDGTNIRDWLYVNDHVSALLKLLEKAELGRCFNIGGGNEYTNLELVTLICQLLDHKRPNSAGSYKNLIKFVDDRPGHDARYSLNFNRIKNEIGWEPETSLKQGLEDTVDWYINHENWWRSVLGDTPNQNRSIQQR